VFVGEAQAMSIIHDANRSIYVAGSSDKRERTRIQMFMAAVRAMGWVQTHPWLDELMRHESLPVVTDEDKMRAAYNDALGVRAANTFVFLVPTAPIRTNASVEFGIAIGARVPNIALVGAPEDIQREFFAALSVPYPWITLFHDDATAIEALSRARRSKDARWGTA
jgi:hypothetical protein